MAAVASPEHKKMILARYAEFIKNLDNVNVDPISVFNPLRPSELEDLVLIRDISKYLQNKKEEEVSKQNQKAEPGQEKEKTEEKKETKEN